jgi:flagellar hook assembly protein FlgD
MRAFPLHLIFIIVFCQLASIGCSSSIAPAIQDGQFSHFELEIDSSSVVQVEIENSYGYTIRRLRDEYMEAGSYIQEWNLMSDTGNPVSQGVYFVRIVTAKSERRTLLLTID